MGIKPLPEALSLARQQDLDLVEVAPMANPPVCRIMDYGKFRYEESQKAKESRKKTVHVSIKEVKFRPKIGKGDFDTKVRHMQDFLAEGHKVKVTLQFRGRPAECSRQGIDGSPGGCAYQAKSKRVGREIRVCCRGRK